jgi:hypothetical protein
MFRQHRQQTILSLLLYLLLVACAPVTAPTAPTATAVPVATVEATATPEEETTSITTPEPITDTVQVENTATSICPEPAAETDLVSDPVAGYCFLIPAGFSTASFTDEIVVYAPETTPGHRERAFVNVETAGGRTLEEVLDDIKASLPGFTATQSSLTLGGVPAIQLDNLPGQDINRKVFAINGDRLYTLTFVPFEADRPDATAETEELYALMLSSFHFMEPTMATSSASVLLTWEGEIDGACHTLVVDASGNAGVALCGDEPTSMAALAQTNEWSAIQEHFGNIDAETPAGKITFMGQGVATGDLWSQALATWASFTAMETIAGRTGASARTVLAWKVTDTAEHSGQCSHLVVLVYGYAYANLIPCEGNGETTQVAAGWLTDTELATLYEWTATGTRVDDEAGYLDAQGTEPISSEEVALWAKAVYARLIQ